MKRIVAILLSGLFFLQPLEIVKASKVDGSVSRVKKEIMEEEIPDVKEEDDKKEENPDVKEEDDEKEENPDLEEEGQKTPEENYSTNEGEKTIEKNNLTETEINDQLSRYSQLTDAEKEVLVSVMLEKIRSDSLSEDAEDKFYNIVVKLINGWISGRWYNLTPYEDELMMRIIFKRIVEPGDNSIPPYQGCLKLYERLRENEINNYFTNDELKDAYHNIKDKGNVVDRQTELAAKIFESSAFTLQEREEKTEFFLESISNGTEDSTEYKIFAYYFQTKNPRELESEYLQRSFITFILNKVYKDKAENTYGFSNLKEFLKLDFWSEDELLDIRDTIISFMGKEYGEIDGRSTNAGTARNILKYMIEKRNLYTIEESKEILQRFTDNPNGFLFEERVYLQILMPQIYETNQDSMSEVLLKQYIEFLLFNKETLIEKEFFILFKEYLINGDGLDDLIYETENITFRINDIYMKNPENNYFPEYKLSIETTVKDQIDNDGVEKVLTDFETFYTASNVYFINHIKDILDFTDVPDYIKTLDVGKIIFSLQRDISFVETIYIPNLSQLDRDQTVDIVFENEGNKNINLSSDIDEGYIFEFNSFNINFIIDGISVDGENKNIGFIKLVNGSNNNTYGNYRNLIEFNNMQIENFGSEADSTLSGSIMHVVDGYQPDVYINHTNIKNNYAGGDGGAFYYEYIDGNRFYINNSSFENNTSLESGGVIHIASLEYMDFLDGSFKIKNSRFNDNNAGIDGGAIFVNYIPADYFGTYEKSAYSSWYEDIESIYKTSFIGNTAGRNGGAIELQTTFDDIYSEGSIIKHIYLSQIKAIENIAGNYGGFIHLNETEDEKSESILNVCFINSKEEPTDIPLIAKNNQAKNGGVFAVKGINGIVVTSETLEGNDVGEKAAFENNIGVENGGVLYLYESKKRPKLKNINAIEMYNKEHVMIKNSSFIHNYSPRGGVFNIADNAEINLPYILAEKNGIHPENNHVTSEKGGFAYIDNGNLILGEETDTQSEVVSSKANCGAVFYVNNLNDNSSLTVNNSKIKDNTGYSTSGLAYFKNIDDIRRFLLKDSVRIEKNKSIDAEYVKKQANKDLINYNKNTEIIGVREYSKNEKGELSDTIFNNYDINGTDNCRPPKPTTEKAEILYDTNGGQGEIIDKQSPYSKNSPVKILGIGQVKRPGYKFIGWSLDKNDTEKDSQFNVDKLIYINEDIQLFAVWKKDKGNIEEETGTIFLEISIIDGKLEDFTEKEIILNGSDSINYHYLGSALEETAYFSKLPLGEYTIEAEEIEGYTLDISNRSVNLDENTLEKTVSITYVKEESLQKDTSYIFKYEDVNGKSIKDDKIYKKQRVGHTIFIKETDKLKIDDYRFLHVSRDSMVLKENVKDNIIVFTYEKEEENKKPEIISPVVPETEESEVTPPEIEKPIEELEYVDIDPDNIPEGHKVIEEEGQLIILDENNVPYGRIKLKEELVPEGGVFLKKNPKTGIYEANYRNIIVTLGIISMLLYIISFRKKQSSDDY